MVLCLLVALILFALAVCAAVSVPPVAVVVALMAATAGSSALPARADCAVAARSTGDAARGGWGEDEGCAGGGSAMAAGVIATVPNLRAGGVVAAAGVDSLTVTQKP